MSATYLFVKNVKTRDPLAKLVLFALSQYANWQTGICWPSAATLAADCECSERSIRYKLDYLAEQGIILIEDRPGRSPMIQLMGYEQWYRDGQYLVEKLDKSRRSLVGDATPAKFAGVHPGKICTPAKSADEHSYSNPSESQYTKGSSIAMAGVASELPEGNARENRASSVDSVERSPPSPVLPLPSETPGYGAGLDPDSPPWEQAPSPPTLSVSDDPIENQSGPVDIPGRVPRGGSGMTQAQRVARRVADKSRADAISTKDWLKLNREDNPEEFADWIDWLEVTGYVAQVSVARRRGYILVPTASLQDGAVLYAEKFPLRSFAPECNSV